VLSIRISPTPKRGSSVPTIATLLALAVPVIANVAIPGAAVLFVVSNASQMGRSAGVC
jgi:threonine/homoserine/homoserine lactone efflux protein